MIRRVLVIGISRGIGVAVPDRARAAVRPLRGPQAQTGVKSAFGMRIRNVLVCRLSIPITISLLEGRVCPGREIPPLDWVILCRACKAVYETRH